MYSVVCVHVRTYVRMYMKEIGAGRFVNGVYLFFTGQH